MKIKSLQLPIVFIALAAIWSVSAFTQDTGLAGSEIAVVQAGDIWLGSDLVGEDTHPTFWSILESESEILEPMWMPDGTTLVFKRRDRETYRSDVLVLKAGSNTPIVVKANTDALFPLTWSLDGERIVYAEWSGETNEMGMIFNVYAIAPEENARPDQIGAFTFGEGCGGGSSFPADWDRWEESGFGGDHPLLKLTPFGLVYTLFCNSATALTDLTTGDMEMLGISTNDRAMPGNLARAVLSPDGTRLAGIEDGQLVIVNLSDRTASAVPTEGTPDQVAWGPDGQIVYSVRVEKSNLAADLSAEEKERVAFGMGYVDVTDEPIVPAYEVSIYLTDLAGHSEQMWLADGYAVGRMAVAPDGTHLVFSLVPNMYRWVLALASGELDAISEPAYAADYVITELYVLPLDGSGEAELLGMDYNQFVLNAVR